MSSAVRNLVQELPFFVQTNHEIELTYGSAMRRFRYKIDTDGYLGLIKYAKLNQ